MRFRGLIIAAAVAFASSGAQAVTYKTFAITWTGTQASAVGQLTFDIDATDNIPGESVNYGGTFSDPRVSDFSMTITDTSGTQTFVKADFGSFVFSAPGPLDFSRELIGQDVNGCSFGTSTGECGQGASGDFNLFSNGQNPLAPNGITYFNLMTSDGSSVLVSSITATDAVPEPASWAMLITGFGLVGATMRRRNRAIAA